MQKRIQNQESFGYRIRIVINAIPSPLSGRNLRNDQNNSPVLESSYS